MVSKPGCQVDRQATTSNEAILSTSHDEQPIYRGPRRSNEQHGQERTNMAADLETSNVLILNTLSSLSQVLQTVFARRDHEHSVDRGDTSNQLREDGFQGLINGLYTEMKEIKKLLATLIEQNQLTLPPQDVNTSCVRITPMVALSRNDGNGDSKRARLDDVSRITVPKVKTRGAKARGKRIPEPLPAESPINLGLPEPEEVERQFDPSRYAGMTETEALQRMREQDQDRRKKERLPETLTLAEQELARTDFARLAREWKRRSAFPIREYDFRDLGVLNEKQLTLPRRMILQILGRRRREAHIRAAREGGVEILHCDVCESQYVKGRNHQCFVTPWVTTQIRGGLPHKKQLVVTQSGKGALKIGQQYTIDENKLEKEREAMTRYRLANEREQVGIDKDAQQIEDISMAADYQEEGPRTIDSPLIDTTEAEEAQTVNIATITPHLLVEMVAKAIDDSRLRYFLEGSGSEYSE